MWKFGEGIYVDEKGTTVKEVGPGGEENGPGRRRDKETEVKMTVLNSVRKYRRRTKDFVADLLQ